ncbi:MAG: insulinase family protein, partial [Deltaproteobacteria bacterium]|nr:insulinase family protein [Deltaproteobacteria bacterium]
MPNGVQVVLVSDRSNPVVSFRIAHLGGKRFESKEQEGIMNFLARMLDKGAGDLSEDDIARKVDEMGGRLNGFSGYDSFGVSGHFFSRHLNQALELLWLIHSQPSFPQDKVEAERKLILNRIETEPDRPVTYTITQLLRVLFPAHPYGHDQEGTLGTVASFTRDDLMRAYRRYAVPSNTVIAAVGDMDLRQTMERIAALFGSEPAKRLETPQIPVEKPLTKRHEELMRIPRAKAHIAIGFQGTRLSDADRYPMEVLNNVLAGQGGRLFLELRDKESLAYVVTSFIRPGLDPGIFALYISCDASKVDRATEGLFRELERIRQEPVDEEELQHAINNLTGNHMIGLQSSLSRAETRALNTLYGLGYDYDTEYIKKIEQVKADQI